jgi:hypothetical protein
MSMRLPIMTKTIANGRKRPPATALAADADSGQIRVG